MQMTFRITKIFRIYKIFRSQKKLFLTLSDLCKNTKYNQINRMA